MQVCSFSTKRTPSPKMPAYYGLRKVTEDRAQYDERSNLYALKQMRKSSGFNEISMCEHLMVG